MRRRAVAPMHRCTVAPTHCCSDAPLPTPHSLSPPPRRLQLFLHFPHRNNGKRFGEDHEQEKEPRKTSHDDSHLRECKIRQTPHERNKLMRQRRCDDDESLEEHSDRDGNRDKHEHRNTPPEPLKPEQLRNDQVAHEERPERPPVIAKRTIKEYRLLPRIVAVPCDEDLDEVCKSHDTRGEQEELGKILKVMIGNVLVQAEGVSHWKQDENDHRKSGVNCSCHKVRRKDRRVSAGHDAHGEIPRDDTVNGDD